MRPDASAGQASHEEPLLQPTVTWPTDMTVDRRHLVTVDLALVKEDGTPANWPLPGEEEYTYTCLLDGGGVFDLWAVHDASVVLHRFGGSYSPAEFVVTPRENKSVRRELWLTIINQWGVSVGDHALEVNVHGMPGRQVTLADPIVVPAGLSAVADELDGDSGSDQDQGSAGSLAAGDEITLAIPHRDLPHRDLPHRDLPHRDLPDVHKDLLDVSPGYEPLAAEPPGSTRPGRTVSDYARAGEDYLRPTEDMLAVPQRDLDVAPQAEPAVPRRRDGARLSVRLAEQYSVAGLRRSRSGRLRWDMLPLFSPGATRGDRVTFTARCAPSDEHGTVFAVLSERDDGSNSGPQLRSAQSAKIPPGIYRVTAELLYPNPGYVRFDGLPTPPREDARPWQEIVTSVPGRLPADGGPVHLIAAIEISGRDDLMVQERLESVRQLILHVAAEARDFVCYSIITYGPHSINFNNREYPEVPATTLAWAETADDALAVLARLSRRGAAPFGYEYAAQLECVLTDLESSLTGQEGRPVMITVGARPPHPPRVDPLTRIIPCGRRNDWTVPIARLRAQYAGMAFGSIRDAGQGDQLWRMLGTNATTVDDYFAPGFAQALGLTSAATRPSAPPIALPMFAG